MTGIPVILDESKPTAEPTVNRDMFAAPLAPGQDEPCVYAAYWHARSGFFNQDPKRTPGGIDTAIKSRP